MHRGHLVCGRSISSLTAERTFSFLPRASPTLFSSFDLKAFVGRTKTHALSELDPVQYQSIRAGLVFCDKGVRSEKSSVTSQLLFFLLCFAVVLGSLF